MLRACPSASICDVQCLCVLRPNGGGGGGLVKSWMGFFIFESITYRRTKHWDGSHRNAIIQFEGKRRNERLRCRSSERHRIQIAGLTEMFDMSAHFCVFFSAALTCNKFL